MRALFSDGNSVRLETNHPPPKPAPGEALVRLRRAMISPFDLASARGETGFVGVIGHQFVGVVDTVHGDAAASRKLVNQRVVGSIIASCNECDLCRKGLAAHCRTRTLMGVCGRDGCCAERFTIAAKQLTLVPASVDDDRAAFAFEVASALHTAQQLTIVNQPYITILGDSALALIMAQVMSKLNASIRVLGRDTDRLDLCEKWNVKHRAIEDVGRRNDQDIVIDCTAEGDGLTAALTMVRPRGKVVLKAIRHTLTTDQSMRSSSLDAVVRHEIELIGSFAGSMSDAIATLAAHEVDVVSLLPRRAALHDSLLAMKASRSALIAHED